MCSHKAKKALDIPSMPQGETMQCSEKLHKDPGATSQTPQASGSVLNVNIHEMFVHNAQRGWVTALSPMKTLFFMTMCINT